MTDRQLTLEEFEAWLKSLPPPNDKLKEAYKRYKENFLNAEKGKQDDVP